ncbi:MAG: winged helix DNA-binding protein [Candidatus Nanohaloarchaeota archaeon QJJ-9]|nr:winged helix DNA-binding protein [Candidatus Nanohaloarchaeota archaeon QJJ-9]
MDDLEEVFLHKKPAKILVGIKRGQGSKYASVLAKDADCTYSHTVKILNKFEEEELIEFDKEGRKKLIQLTEEGEELASDVASLLNTLEEM